MFEDLKRYTSRPKPFEFYTIDLLWNDPYVSKKMLELHLDEQAELASRNKAFVDRSSNWIINRFDLGRGKTVCDLGCGPGLYTSRFAQTGCDVTGVDLSERSIEYARGDAVRRDLDIAYVQSNYLEFSTNKRFDLVTMIYCDFCVLSPKQRRRLLGIIHGCLNGEGALLFDVLSTQQFDATDEKLTLDFSARNGFWTSEPYYVIENSLKYDDEALLLDKHVIIELDRTREVFNWLQCYSPDSLRDDLERCGFTVCEQYANVAGDDFEPESTQFAVIARKAD